MTSRRVLIVDDNVDSAASVAAFLRLAGHDVRMAHDGHAALHGKTVAVERGIAHGADHEIVAAAAAPAEGAAAAPAAGDAAKAGDAAGAAKKEGGKK